MAPLSDQDFRWWRYWRAATDIGKLTILILFLAYTKGITSSYRDEVITYYGLLNKKKPNKKTPEQRYEAAFNSTEKKKIEDPAVKPEELDISLIDKMLRRMHQITNLEFDFEEIWTKTDPAAPNTSIEYRIYCIKWHRNKVSHEKHDMSETELEATLMEMEKNYISLIDDVLTDRKYPQTDIDNEKDKIQKIFLDLKCPIREPLSIKDIALYHKDTKDHLEKLLDEIVLTSQNMLGDEYGNTLDTNPAAWLDREEFDCETDQIFSEMEIMEEDKQYQNNVVTKVDFNKLLEQTTKKSQEPRVITITADGGFGKTTSTRMLVLSWIKKSKIIINLMNFRILLYIEIRSATERSLIEILKNRFGSVMSDLGLSSDTFMKIMLSLKTLIILDGQDEAIQNYLLSDLLDKTKNSNTFKLLITTRPTASVDLQKLVITFNMPRLDLKIIGIDESNQVEFIFRYVKNMERDVDRQNEIMQSVKERIPHLNRSLGNTIMNSPLMLSIFAFLWVVGEILDTVTVTEIFTKIHDSLKDKLITRLLKRLTTSRQDESRDEDVISQYSSSILDEKLNEFHVYLRYLAFLTFSEKEFNFTDRTTDLLMKKIDKIKLGGVKDEIMEHYLASRKSRKGLRVVVKYSYRHSLLQEFDASQHVCDILATGSDKDIAEKMNQLKAARYNNIRAHTIATLAAEYPELLAQYGKQIINCEKPGKDNEVDSYLNLIMESKLNTTVVKMTAAALAEMTSWTVKSSSLVAALMDVILLTQPSKLKLNLSKQSQLPPTLASCICTIASYDLELDLMLDTRPTGGPAAAPVTHDDHLMAAIQPEPRATLIRFYGRLSGSALPMLPSSLGDLIIGVSVADLPHLYNKIPELTQLYRLTISMSTTNLDRVCDLPQLQTSGSLVHIDVSLYGAGDSDVPHIATLLNTCTPTTGRELRNGLMLRLLDATLTGEGGIQLMKSLSDAQVTCGVIDIRSTQAPAQDQQDDIKDQARHCFNKSMFSSIKWRCGGVTLDLTPQ